MKRVARPINMMRKTYDDKWYKVWYRWQAPNGENYMTFVYAFGDDHVKSEIKATNAVKVSESSI